MPCGVLLVGSSSSTTTSGSSGSKPGSARAPRCGAARSNIGIVAEIDGFYPPTNHWDTNGFLYANAIYDPLMAIAADGTIQPYLAQSMHPQLHLRHLDDDPAAERQVPRRLAARPPPW